MMNSALAVRSGLFRLLTMVAFYWGKLISAKAFIWGSVFELLEFPKLADLSAVAESSEFDTTKVGKNVYIGAGIRTENFVHIGDDSVISRDIGGKTYIKTGTFLQRGVTLENVKQIGENCEIAENVCLRRIHLVGRKAVFAPGVTVENCRLIKNKAVVKESIDYKNSSGAFRHPDGRRIAINNIHAKNYEYD